MLRATVWAGAMAIVLTSLAWAAPGAAITDPAQAGPDFAVQGEYQGEMNVPDQTEPLKVGAQVIALGGDTFHGVFFLGGLPGDGWERGGPQLEADGSIEDGKAVFQGEGGAAEIENGEMKVLDPSGNELATLKKIERKSPTLGAKPPEDAKVLFDGTNADAWNGGRIVEDNLLAVGTTSKDEFGDFTAHVEFRTPYMPKSRGQGRGNSGVYLQDRYEVQVLDSFGLEGANNECGGIYGAQQPTVNMCLPPLSWQTYDIDFTAARFDGDQKTSNARVTIKHNGVTIFDDLDLPNLTPGGASSEAPGKGPFKLQHHGNPVTYRNIWVVEKSS